MHLVYLKDLKPFHVVNMIAWSPATMRDASCKKTSIRASNLLALTRHRYVFGRQIDFSCEAEEHKDTF